MARETEDRRVRKTKKQLRNALTTLLQDRDISRITVRDVAELADVNRGTFYAHYTDVHDLLAHLENEFLSRLEEIGTRHSVHAQSSCEEKFAYLTDLFRMADEYSDIFTTLCVRNGSPEFRNKMFQMLKKQYLQSFLEANDHTGDPTRIAYCSSFIVAGVCTLTIVWIEKGKKESPEEMAKLSGEFILNGVAMLK